METPKLTHLQIEILKFIIENDRNNTPVKFSYLADAFKSHPDFIKEFQFMFKVYYDLNPNMPNDENQTFVLLEGAKEVYEADITLIKKVLKNEKGFKKWWKENNGWVVPIIGILAGIAIAVLWT